MVDRKPSFFIVGSPKCGTTAMHEYLSQHPHVSMAPKELHFFGTDLRIIPPMANFENVPRTPAEVRRYLGFFRADAKARGDASVFYLYSTRAAQEIHEFVPDAKIIIMVRRHADMMHSLHVQNLYSGNETLHDFERALDAEADRAKGNAFPAWTFNKDGLLYRRIADYAPQIRRYYDIFGRGRVRVIVFDDFKAATLDTVKETLRFLDLDDAFEPDIEIVNPSKQARSSLIRRLYMRPRPILRRLARTLMPANVRSKSRNALIRINTRVQPRTPMRAEVRASLDREFEPKVDELAELIGADLAGWKS